MPQEVAGSAGWRRPWRSSCDRLLSGDGSSFRHRWLIGCVGDDHAASGLGDEALVQSVEEVTWTWNDSDVQNLPVLFGLLA